MAGFFDTVADDWQIDDANEAATLSGRRGATPFSYSIIAATLEHTADEISRLGGMWEVGDKLWTIGRNQAAFPDGFEPAAGDKLTVGTRDYALKGKAETDGLRIAWVIHTGKWK